MTWFRPVLTTMALAALAGSACSRSRAAASESADVPTVAVAKAARGDIAQSLTIAAEFRPFQEIEVHAKVAGYLKSISVDVGDRVKAGQLLAVLEIPELQDEIKQDEAAVKRANEEIRRAQADVERAQSAHEVAHLNATRLTGVMKTRPNLVAQQDIDEATGRDRVSEAQVSTAEAALAADKEQLEIAKAAQSKTQTLFDYARITAPFTGVITHRYAVLTSYARSLRRACAVEVTSLRKRASRGELAMDMASLKRLRQWFHSDLRTLSEIDRARLLSALENSKALKTMYAMRQELAALWERSNDSREQLLARLQDWCHRAETSDIVPLQNFSRRLRSYA